MRLPSPSNRFQHALRLLSITLLPLVAATAAQSQSPGAQEQTFATGVAANGGFYALALQGNGQVIVGGNPTDRRDFSPYRTLAGRVIRCRFPD